MDALSYDISGLPIATILAASGARLAAPVHATSAPMPDNLIDVLKLTFQYVLPPLLGASGLVAVWYKGRVDQDHEKGKRRRELIDTWRKELLADWDNAVRIGGPETKYAFMERPAYWSLRGHLSPEFRSELEGSTVVIWGGDDGALFPRIQLGNEISRIEKKWNLV